MHTPGLHGYSSVCLTVLLSFLGSLELTSIIAFIFFMVTRESIFYVNLRQAYLLSPLYARRVSSRTVLFTSVPEDYLDEAKLRRMFGRQMKNLWVATDTKKIEDLVKERDKVAFKLEGAETKLIKLANAARLKSMKNGGHHDDESHLGSNMDGDGSGESGSVAARWIKAKQRPTHRTKPLVGKKVDTINWCRAELQRLIEEVEREQSTHRAGDGKFVGSVFVEFYTQSDAQAAFQMLAHHQALHMAPRFIGVNPGEVIWKNLRIKWWERIIRNAATITFVILLIIFWSIPVAVVGIISNINYITGKVPFLKFINSIPPAILGVVTGLLPSILLAVLMALLPIILRSTFTPNCAGVSFADSFSSDGQTWRPADLVQRGIENSELLLWLPSCAGLPGDHFDLCSVSSGHVHHCTTFFGT